MKVTLEDLQNDPTLVEISEEEFMSTVGQQDVTPYTPQGPGDWDTSWGYCMLWNTKGGKTLGKSLTGTFRMADRTRLSVISRLMNCSSTMRSRSDV